MSRRYKKVRGRVVPPRPPWLSSLCLGPCPGKIHPSRVPVPPAFSPCYPEWLLPDDRLCLGPADRSRGSWCGWPNGVPWPHPQVKMQCRKGIPSALRARCWPLLCGAHVCQQNSRDTYQVRELAGVPPPFPGPSPLWAFTFTFLSTHRNWLRPLGTHSGWRPSAGTCTASSLFMRCLCHPRVTGMRPVMPRDPQPHNPQVLWPSTHPPAPALYLCISKDPARPSGG